MAVKKSAPPAEPRLFRHRFVFTARNRDVALGRVRDERRRWIIRQVLSFDELMFTDAWPRLRRLLDDPERPTAPAFEEWEGKKQKKERKVA